MESTMMVQVVNLQDVSVDSWVGYVIAALVPGGDAVIPVLPGETVMITIGLVGSATHDPRTIILLVLGIVSAWVGDQTSYFLGGRFGEPLLKKYVRGEKGAKTIAWAERSLDERAATLLVLARFIPGGRTALTLTAGATHFDKWRFRLYTAFAAVLWGLYSAGLGYIGGQTFKDNHWLALGVALAGGFTITGLIEGVRWLRGRHKADEGPAQFTEEGAV